MQSEVAQPAGAGQIAGRLRDEDLPSVSDRRDARGAMHIDADVALVGNKRLSGVDTDPHANRPAEGVIRVARSAERV